MSPPGTGLAFVGQGFPRVSGDEPGAPVGQGLPQRFPRVSGDEPRCTQSALRPCTFSPREWG